MSSIITCFTILFTFLLQIVVFDQLCFDIPLIYLDDNNTKLVYSLFIIPFLSFLIFGADMNKEDRKVTIILLVIYSISYLLIRLFFKNIGYF